MWQSMCSPAVPLETAAAYGAPTRSAKSSSNRSIAGPSDSRPERRTSRTASSSRSSRYGRESGTRVSVFTPPLAPRSRPSRTRATAPSARSCRGTVSRYAVWSSFVTGPGGPMHAVVHLADRRHLGGGAGHEDLVGRYEIGADQVLLLDRVAEVLRDLDQRVTRDPGQDRRRERRRRDLPVLDDEDVLARAVGDEAVRGEQDRLVVAGAVRLASPRASSSGRCPSPSTRAGSCSARRAARTRSSRGSRSSGPRRRGTRPTASS